MSEKEPIFIVDEAGGLGTGKTDMALKLARKHKELQTERKK